MESDKETSFSDYEQEMLKKLEARYSLPAEEESPFRGLPVHRKELIRGTHFLAYVNESEFRSLLSNFPDELIGSPILYYSEKNRFQGICRTLMLDWHQELDRITELLLDAEEGRDTEEELSTFGIRVHDDCYVCGYAGVPPVFASKDLLLSILNFAVESGSAAHHVPLEYRSMCRRSATFLNRLRLIIPHHHAV